MIDLCQVDFANTPVSTRRPRFAYAPDDPSAPPVVSIVTAFYRPGPVFRETWKSVMCQSLQQWEWLVVDDGSSDASSSEILDDLAAADPRIRVIHHGSNRGRSAARNTGVAAARADFVYQLDQDDLLEPTTLEKTFWYLVSHPECAFANGWSVGFGAREYVWTKGFEKGPAFLDENFVTGRAMVRKSAFEAAGGYDESLVHGFEDWDFWLRCAKRGLWGGTLPECLDWHRRRQRRHDEEDNWQAKGRVDAFREELRKRHRELYQGGFSVPSLPGEHRRPGICEELPCQNLLAKRARRALLLVPSLGRREVDPFCVDLVNDLTRQGWEVSLMAAVRGIESPSSRLGRYTPDIHVLANFLALEDVPRYLHYFVRSRRPDAVLASAGELSNRLVEYLRSHCPESLYLDLYLLDPDAGNRPYPTRVSETERVVDHHVVTSTHLARWMVEHGAAPERIDVFDSTGDADPQPDGGGGRGGTVGAGARFAELVEGLRSSRPAAPGSLEARPALDRAVQAVESLRVTEWTEALTAQCDELRKRLADRETEIEELRQWNEQLTEARAWLDGQWRAWKELAEQRGDELTRQSRELQESESARTRLGQQLEALEEAKARLDRECAQLSQRLGKLGRLSWWRLVALRLSRGWESATDATGSERGDAPSDD